MKFYICDECIGDYCLISLSGTPGIFQCPMKWDDCKDGAQFRVISDKEVVEKLIVNSEGSQQ